jgi:hypothetical protein
MQFFLLYIDPGSGSYFIQLIIAAVLGAGFFFKNFWHRIMTFVAGIKSKKEDGKDAGKKSFN